MDTALKCNMNFFYEVGAYELEIMEEEKHAMTKRQPHDASMRRVNVAVGCKRQ